MTWKHCVWMFLLNIYNLVLAGFPCISENGAMDLAERFTAQKSGLACQVRSLFPWPAKKWPIPIPISSCHKPKHNPDFKSLNLTKSTSKYGAFSGLLHHMNRHDSTPHHPKHQQKKSTELIMKIAFSISEIVIIEDSDPLPSEYVSTSTSTNNSIVFPWWPSSQASHSSGRFPVFSSSASSRPKISASNAASVPTSSFSWRRNFSSETSDRRAKEASDDWSWETPRWIDVFAWF